MQSMAPGDYTSTSAVLLPKEGAQTEVHISGPDTFDVVLTKNFVIALYDCK